MTLEPHQWITVASCAGHLGLATIALRRIGKSALGLPLALLCLDLFVFNLADVAGHVTGGREWVWLDVAAASLLVPLTMRFALAFVGRGRQLVWIARGFDLYFGTVAILVATAFVGVEWARNFAGTARWVMTLVPGAIAAVAVLAWLFTSHLRSSPSPVERARTWLMMGGLALGAAGGVCDLLANSGFDVPRLGPFGLLLTTVILTLSALRVGLFEGKISWLIAANGIVLGGLQLFGYIAVFYFFGGNTALLVVGLGTLTLALVPALVAMTRAATSQRQRLEYHATLGRFSAQMAHDLRNPLAAIKGAAQYLKEEQARGRPVDGEYLTLIVDQADRLNRVVADYQRIGRIETVLKPLNLNALVEEVLGGQTLAAPAGITLRRELLANGAQCQADRDLISAALENLVRNAFEAMPAGGVVTVQTQASDPGFVQLSVADTGSGMDPRLAAQVFSDFFTTKTTGSGLGLAFVRRVAEAHGGEAALKSAEGKGTTVQLRLPILAS